MIYLDHNATTPLRPEARDAMLPWLGPPANPSSVHGLGRAAADAVEEARAEVAALCGWPAGGVIFTSGASEANNTVLSEGRWAVSSVEHPSVLARGAVRLPVDASGRLLPAGELDRLDPHIDGVAVMLANNETGVIQPVEQLDVGARWLHIDGAQAPGRLPVPLRFQQDLRRLSVSLSAHKLGGPVGVGALLVHPRRKLAGFMLGGSQEGGRRGGTVPVALIAGFGAAARAVRAEGAWSPALRDRLERGAVGLGGVVAGAGAARLPNTLAVGFPGIDAADLVIHLDLGGVAVSAGAACASGSPRPSHVLEAMGFGGSAVRFSLGRGTTEAEVDAALRALARALEQLRSGPASFGAPSGEF